MAVCPSRPARMLLLLLACLVCLLVPGAAAAELHVQPQELERERERSAPLVVAAEEGGELSGHGGSNKSDGDSNSNRNSSARQLAHTGPECGEDGSGLNHDGVPCKFDYEEESSLYIDGYVDHTITGAQLTNGRYPSTTLSCYSSYTKPDGMLICPESRSKYCVKELSTLKQDLCGQSQYFGDQYLENLCVLRKCASECEEGQYSFQYGGLTYVRQRYCCEENYCNSSSRNFASATVLTVLAVILSCMCMVY